MPVYKERWVATLRDGWLRRKMGSCVRDRCLSIEMGPLKNQKMGNILKGVANTVLKQKYII